MTHIVSWDNDEHTIIRVDNSDPYFWEDAFAGQRESSAMIDTVSQQVSLILDLSRVTKLPPNAMANIRTLMSRNHPRTPYIAFVGMNPFIRAMDNIVGQVYRSLLSSEYTKTFHTKDLAEARVRLARLQGAQVKLSEK